MKDVFDYLEEEDLLRNLPEALPQMEDETAAKRIEKMALEKLQAEAKQQKKWQKRRILIAAVCCLVAVGAFARKPIAAYFQRILHYLPGVGVYINDTDAEIYEVQIDNPCAGEGRCARGAERLLLRKQYAERGFCIHRRGFADRKKWQR